MALILVVDDDPGVIALVERGLKEEGHEVITARHGVQALRIMQEKRPNLVILDIIMPGTSGLEVCQRMRRSPGLCAVPILFLTKKDEIEDRIEGLKAGADDYLGKPFDLRELQWRVRAILRSTLETPRDTVLSMGPLSLTPATLEATLWNKPVGLTPVEFELLYYLTRNAGRVISSDQLLQQVWGYPEDSRNTALVRMHIMNLRAKIEPDPRHPRFIKTVTRHGYVATFSSEEED